MTIVASNSLTVSKVDDGANGDTGLILSNTAPANPTVGQLWQDTSSTPMIVSKWTGTEWDDSWGLYAENLIVNNLSVLGYYMDVDDTTGILIDNGEVRTVSIATTTKYRIYQGSKFNAGAVSFFNRWEAIETTATGVQTVLQDETFLFSDSYRLGNVNAYGAPNVDSGMIYNAFTNSQGTGGKHIFFGDMTIGGNLTAGGDTKVTYPTYTHCGSGIYAAKHLGVLYIRFENTPYNFKITMPEKFRPISNQMFLVPQWSAGTLDMVHVQFQTDGSIQGLYRNGSSTGSLYSTLPAMQPLNTL